MSDGFVRFDRVGNGYLMRSNEGRGDTLMHMEKHVVGTSSDFNTGVLFADYTACIVGSTGGTAGPTAASHQWMVQDSDDLTWHIKTLTVGTAGAFVNVLYIHRSMCTDNAVTTQA